MPITITSGLVFSRAGETLLKGDLYLPEGLGPHPVLVAAPGGGWRRGDKSQLAHWGTYLAEQGVAVFVIDYRRSTAGKVFPQNLEDVVSALAFVRDQGPGLSLDPDRMGLIGASAGAHLAALAALDNADRTTFPVRVLVGVYGVYDLVSHWQTDLDRNQAPGEDPTERMLGSTPFEDQELYFLASPLRGVTYARNALKVLLVWGQEDTDILPAQSEAFARSLRQARFMVRTIPVPGAGHFWFSEEKVAPDTFSGAVAPRLAAFLRQHLVGAPRP